MDKIKILALFGKSGAGKDYMANWILNKYPNLTNRIVRHTTREKRANEWNKVDYHFIPVKKFTGMVLNNKFIEAECFNDWFYGTSFSSLDKKRLNIGCYSINAIETLLSDNRLEVLPVYIKSLDRVRLLRSLNRDPLCDCSEICRRFLADEKDFGEGLDFPFHYCTYYNDENLVTDIKSVKEVREFLNKVKL
ncbi:MAG: GMPK protein [Caudoviricetes sp.]|nr:MAG: GMPK protein [Caudoviricetes sp.]